MTGRICTIIFEYLDKRYSIRGIIEKDLLKRVPILNWTYFFGGLSLSLFMLQILTGVLLLVYYQPSTDEAYNSVINISNNIPFGWLYRGLHVWGANFMIIAVFCHLTRIYFQGVYKYPREVNWIIGVCLLMGTLTFSFTGYLLPWTQLSYWATTVGTEIPAALPVIGGAMKTLIRGGDEITQITLSRFFVLHVTVLPIGLLGLVGLHLAIVRLVGISEPLSSLQKEISPEMDNNKEKTGPGKEYTGKKYKGPTMPFYLHILKELPVVILVTGVLLTLTVLFPHELDGKADPFTTPAHIKPEWYFLAGYQLLKVAENLSFLGSWAPKLIGVALQGVFVFILVLVPFIDRGKERLLSARKGMIFSGLAATLLFLLLTIWGHFS